MGMSHLAVVSQYVGKANVAICDTKRSTRFLFKRLGYRTFPSVERAAEKLDCIDGVLVATPTPAHFVLAKWAIQSRLPCFIEKPLTLDVERSRELLRLAEASGVHVQMGFVLRYLTSFQQLRQLVHGKKLGPLVSYSATMRGNVMTSPPAPGNWQGDFSRGGGALNEYGPHIIDLCRFIFGDVESIGAVEMTRVYSPKADDKIAFHWNHDGGATAQVVVDWSDPSKRKSVVEIFAEFECARVRVDNSTLDIEWRNDVVKEGPEADKYVLPNPASVGFYLRGEEFSLEIEDFLAHCLGQSAFPFSPSVFDATPLVSDGFEVDRIINEIAMKAGLQ
jgi:scyllo-inositol 2-dehydrogenase (NADP+)